MLTLLQIVSMWHVSLLLYEHKVHLTHVILFAFLNFII